MKLPPLEGDEVDVNALEVSLGTRYARKTAKLISDGTKEKQKTEERYDSSLKSLFSRKSFCLLKLVKGKLHETTFNAIRYLKEVSNL